MRASIALAAVLLPALVAAQPRVQEGASGTGYSVVGGRARVGTAAATGTTTGTTVATGTTAATPPAPASGSATISTVSGGGSAPGANAVITTTAGPRGPGEPPTVTLTTAPGRASAPVAGRESIAAGDTTYVVGRDGNIVAVQRVPAPAPAADAGVDDPNVPTAGALYGGPLPGPSIAYMGIPVNTRRPPPAPPLAPGAVAPGHALPGSTPAPPGTAAPWIPWSTSGYQLGPSGASTDTSGYGFQIQGGATNPGTLRNPSPR